MSSKCIFPHLLINESCGWGLLRDFSPFLKYCWGIFPHFWRIFEIIGIQLDLMSSKCIATGLMELLSCLITSRVTRDCIKGHPCPFDVRHKANHQLMITWIGIGIGIGSGSGSGSGIPVSGFPRLGTWNISDVTCGIMQMCRCIAPPPPHPHPTLPDFIIEFV